MQNGYILVLDSGVGGLSVLKELVKRVKGERFLYFGDNLNAPYGSKSKEELITLTKNNLEFAGKYKIKAVVLACNTLSVSLYDDIKKLVCVPVFGVFPPYNEIDDKTVLLATPLTCKGLDKDYFKVYPLYNLAKDIEDNLFDLKKVNLNKHFACLKEKFDTVILGCTHYELLKNEIFNHLKPLKIISGVSLCVDQVFNFCCGIKSSVKYKRNHIFFIGESAKRNKLFYKKVVKKL